MTTRHILFSQLSNLPRCDPEGKNLQSLYNRVYALTRQFCAFEDDSKEIAFGAILLKKIPRHKCGVIYDKIGNSRNLTPTELRQILTGIVHKEATLQEIKLHCKTAQHPGKDESVSLHKSHRKKAQDGNRSSRYSTAMKRIQPTLANPKICSFYESSQHLALTCPQSPTPKLLAQIKDKRPCFKCLSSKHRTK